MSITIGLHEPQPVPARVRAITSRGVSQPSSSTAATISPLQTPLQLQICASSGRSSGPAAPASARRASGSRDLLAGLHRGQQRLGAAHVAEQDRAGRPPVAHDELAVDARGGVGGDRLDVALGVADGHEVDARDLELGAHAPSRA